MENKLLCQARDLLERATGLWPPRNVEFEWADDLPDGAAGSFNSKHRVIKISVDYRRPKLILVHELAHAVHWDATRYAHVCDAEIERFAICAELMVEVMLYGKVKHRYDPHRKSYVIYKQAEDWFERHTPEQVKAWMQYVLCF
jgi:hypothetical protein